MNFNEKQLIEMLEMQKSLDKYIMDNHNIEYNEETAEKVELALLVELGELLNELPSHFKYWKPNVDNNKEAALEEFADCMCFAMSLHNYHEANNTFITDEELDLNANMFVVCTSIFLGAESLLSRLLILGNNLGFTWEEIYESYMKKNKINYERQVSNESYINKEREIGKIDDK